MLTTYVDCYLDKEYTEKERIGDKKVFTDFQKVA